MNQVKWKYQVNWCKQNHYDWPLQHLSSCCDWRNGVAEDVTYSKDCFPVIDNWQSSCFLLLLQENESLKVKLLLHPTANTACTNNVAKSAAVLCTLPLVLYTAQI
jgi:hypothetical protein